MSQTQPHLVKSRSSSRLTRTQTAWVIIWIAFAFFVFFFFTIPMSIGWYIEYATVSEAIKGQGTSGVTLIAKPDLPPDAVIRLNSGEERQDITEGSQIRTDAASQVLLEFFDKSVIIIFPNSDVVLSEVRRPRFGRSSEPNRIVIALNNGRVRAQVATPSGRPIHFEVQTVQAPPPNGGILLESGSHTIETNNSVSHISVRTGSATITGQTGSAITLQANERAEIPLGTAPLGPFPAKRNLLVNSDFRNLEVSSPISEGLLAEGWQVKSNQGGDGGDVNGTVDVVPTSATRLLHFMRQESDSNHGETSVEQAINQLIDLETTLLLRFDIRIVSQSLQGGGIQNSEFPLIVQLDYEDRNGESQQWRQGYYCLGHIPLEVTFATKIPCDNRLNVEIDPSQLSDIKRLKQLRLYASGWDWDVYISDLELIAE